MAIIKAVKGFKDILPAEAGQWRYVEEKAREIFSHFGVREIRTPLLEKTELFQRGIGAATDIVEKEMYTFIDRSDESLTLRPEATASLIRAYVEHNMYATDPVAKLFTIGPMFRRERPQKGRFRQFHQINAEFLGLADHRVDGEIVLLLMHLLNSLELGVLRLEINSLGCPDCRTGFRDAIRNFLDRREADLCDDCRRRLTVNPLRILDCKVEGCREITMDSPLLPDFLCAACDDHFTGFKKALDNFGLAYIINPRMVRGLDYYTRTAFEVTTEFLGAQNAVAGGGRYDRLVAELGGPEIPGIGFAIGMERLLHLLPPIHEDFPLVPQLFIAALGSDAGDRAYDICNRLRLKGLWAEADYTGRSLKSQMKRADKLGSLYVLILGDRELAEGRAELRSMLQGTQETVDLEALEEKLLEKIKISSSNMGELP